MNINIGGLCINYIIYALIFTRILVILILVIDERDFKKQNKFL